MSRFAFVSIGLGLGEFEGLGTYCNGGGVSIDWEKRGTRGGAGSGEWRVGNRPTPRAGGLWLVAKP